MSRNCIHDHQNDWEFYVSALTYPYNKQVQNSTKTKPFELVLSRPTKDFTLQPKMLNCSAATRETRDEFSKRIDIIIQRAHGDLEATQGWYKRSVEKRLRRIHRRLCAENYIYIDPFDRVMKLSKLHSSAEEPFHIISADRQTIYTERERFIELVFAKRAVYALLLPEKDITRDAHELQPSKSDNRKKTHEDPKYVVGLQPAHRLNAEEGLLFKVKCTDYSEPIYKLPDCISEEPVSRYFRRL